MEKLSLSKQVDQVLETYKGDPFRRGQELNKILKKAEKASDIYTIGKANLYLSICVFQQGRRDSILSYAYKAVNILKQTKDYGLLARSYNLLGIAYAGQGNYQRALTAYNQALAVIRGRKCPAIRRETLLNNIGDSYFQMGVYQKSLKIALDCLSDCRRDHPENHFAIVLYGINSSDSYCSLGDFKSAKAVLDEVDSDAKQIEESIMLCGYHTRQAWVQYALGDVEAGARDADRMMELVDSKFDSYEFHPVFVDIVLLQIKIGDLERARRIADSLTAYSDRSGHTLDLINSKRAQASISCAVGERDRALALYKELNGHYEDWKNEQKTMQYEAQKSVESASKEIGKLMDKIRASEEKADRDPLTGLMNRSALVRVTTEFIQTAKRHGRKVGGIFLDIDYFKEYNDTYGHAAGDEAIKCIANICLGEVNSNVHFFRYGGDEYFGIILGHTDEELAALALRISNRVRQSGIDHVKNPNGQRLTVSVGIVNVEMNDVENTILDIIKYADKALYHAKDRGKDDVFAYCFLPDSEHEFRRIE